MSHSTNILPKTTNNSTCAFTPTVTFQQTPTYNDFITTLGAVGLVVWTIGTFALVNFMLYFNKREKEEEEKEKSLVRLLDTRTDSDLELDWDAGAMASQKQGLISVTLL